MTFVARFGVTAKRATKVTRVYVVYCTVQYCHSPARGLCELHMGWGLLEPLIHSQHGAIVSMVESLIKSHVFFSYEDVYAYYRIDL